MGYITSENFFMKIKRKPFCENMLVAALSEKKNKEEDSMACYLHYEHQNKTTTSDLVLVKVAILVCISIN